MISWFLWYERVAICGLGREHTIFMPCQCQKQVDDTQAHGMEL